MQILTLMHNKKLGKKMIIFKIMIMKMTMRKSKIIHLHLKENPWIKLNLELIIIIFMAWVIPKRTTITRLALWSNVHNRLTIIYGEKKLNVLLYKDLIFQTLIFKIIKRIASNRFSINKFMIGIEILSKRFKEKGKARGKPRKLYSLYLDWLQEALRGDTIPWAKGA